MQETINEGEVYTENASKIVKTLAKNKTMMAASELKKELDIDWNTVRNNLILLEKFGRIHTQYIGGQKYYGLNGKGRHQDSLKLDNSEYLWLDIFEPNPSLDEHFLRIKQTRLKGLNKWEPVGTINIKKSQIDELISKLKSLKELEKHYPSG